MINLFLILLGVYALHADFILFGFYHVMGKHSMEVWNTGSQNDSVRSKLLIPNLKYGHRLKLKPLKNTACIIMRVTFHESYNDPP